MSTWKSASNDPVKPQVESDTLGDLDKSAAPRPVAKIEVTSLRIDDEFDSGGDPYNQTGQYCVEELKKLPTD